jgi:hypothetical protein
MIRSLTAVALLIACLAAEPSVAQQTPAAPATPPPAAETQPNIDPAALAAAHRLIVAGHLSEGLDAMVDAMVPQFVQAEGRSRGLTPSQVALVGRVVREEMAAGRPELMDLMARLYALHLSAADLNAAADFYETDAGKHFIAAQDQMSSEGMAIGRAWARERTPHLVQRIEEELRTPGGTQP